MIGFVRRYIGPEGWFYIIVALLVAYGSILFREYAPVEQIRTGFKIGDLGWIAYALIVGLSLAQFRGGGWVTESKFNQLRILLGCLGMNSALFSPLGGDWLVVVAWAAVAVLVTVRIFCFYVHPGNYIVDGVVKKAKEAFWLKPGTKIEVLPEYIEVSGSGVCEGNLRCTVSGRRTYAACFVTGDPVDVEADRKAFLACLVESMQKFSTVDTYHKRIDSEFQRSVRERYYLTKLHWTLEPLEQ